jgi:hypothetical protein
MMRFSRKSRRSSFFNWVYADEPCLGAAIAWVDSDGRCAGRGCSLHWRMLVLTAKWLLMERVLYTTVSTTGLKRKRFGLGDTVLARYLRPHCRCCATEMEMDVRRISCIDSSAGRLVYNASLFGVPRLIMSRPTEKSEVN